MGACIHEGTTIARRSGTLRMGIQRMNRTAVATPPPLSPRILDSPTSHPCIRDCGSTSYLEGQSLELEDQT